MIKLQSITLLAYVVLNKLRKHIYLRTLLSGAKSFLRSSPVLSQSKNSPHIEPEGSFTNTRHSYVSIKSKDFLTNNPVTPTVSLATQCHPSSFGSEFSMAYRSFIVA
jgi:hypothetical protein